ncbi:MAG: oligosaccharide flippase family protein [Promethearchaeota archaeon]
MSTSDQNAGLRENGSKSAFRKLVEFAGSIFVNKDTVVIFASNLTNILLGTLIIGMISGHLTVELFGVYSLMVGFVDLTYRIAEFGINTAVIKHSSLAYREGDEDLARQYLKMGFLLRLAVNATVFIVGVTVVSPLLSHFWADDAISANLVRLGFVGVVSASFFQYVNMTFQTSEKFVHFSLLLVFKISCQFALVLATIFLQLNVLYGALLAFFLVPLLATVVGLLLSDRQFLRVKIRDWRELNREIYSFARWIFVNVTAALLISNLDIFVVKQFLSTEDVALYYAAFTLCTIITALNSSLTAYLLPEVSRLKTREEYGNYLKRSSQFLGVLFVVYVPVVLFSPVLVPLLFRRPEYARSVPLFQVLLVGFIFTLFRSQLDLVLISENKPEIPALFNAIRLGVLVAGYALLVPVMSLSYLVAWNAFVRGLGALFIVAYVKWKVLGKGGPNAHEKEEEREVFDDGK